MSRKGGIVMPPLYYGDGLPVTVFQQGHPADGDDRTQVADLHFQNGRQISEALAIDREQYEARTPPGGWQLYQGVLQAILARLLLEVNWWNFGTLFLAPALSEVEGAVVVAGHYPLRGPAADAAAAR